MKPFHNPLLYLAFLFSFIISPRTTCAYSIGDTDIHIRTTGAITYDDNITYIPENTVSDFTTGLTIGIDASRESKNTLIGLRGSITHEFFRDHTDYDNTSEDFTLNLTQEFSKYDRIHITNRFHHSEEPRSWEDVFGRRGGRYSYYRNAAGITYSRDITRQLTFISRYTNQQDYYTNKSNPDSHLDRINLETDYFITSQDGIILAYNYSRRCFRQGEAATINNITSGLKHYFTTRLYFDGMAGLDFIIPYSGQSRTKPVYSASLTDEIDETSTIALSYIKQYQAVPYSTDLFNSWQASFDADRQILERLRGTTSLFYGEGEYTTAGIKDKFTGIRIAFTYDIKDTWQSRLSYTHSTTDSNIYTREYTKNTITLTLTANF